MEIESTTVEMFWWEKNTVFSAFIVNICPEKKEITWNWNTSEKYEGKYSKIDKSAKREGFQGSPVKVCVYP